LDEKQEDMLAVIEQRDGFEEELCRMADEMTEMRERIDVKERDFEDLRAILEKTENNMEKLALGNVEQAGKLPEEWHAIGEVGSLKDALSIALEKEAHVRIQLEETEVKLVKAGAAERNWQKEAEEWKQKCESTNRRLISAQRESDALMRYCDKMDYDKASQPVEVAYEDSLSRGAAEDLLATMVKLRDKLGDKQMLETMVNDGDSMMSPPRVKRGLQANLQTVGKRTPRGAMKEVDKRTIASSH